MKILNYLKVLLSYLKVCLTPITVHAVLSNSAVGDVCRYRTLTADRVRFTHAHFSYLPHHHARKPTERQFIHDDNTCIKRTNVQDENM